MTKLISAIVFIEKVMVGYAIYIIAMFAGRLSMKLGRAIFSR